MKKYKLNIPAALQQRNLTRRALAKRMKVTEPSVTSYIQGNPTIDKIYAIAEALECSVLDLFFPEESDPAASPAATLDPASSAPATSAPATSDPATSAPATSDPLADIDFSDTLTQPTAPTPPTPPTSPTPTYTPLHSPTPIVTLPVPVLVTMPPIICPHCNGVIVLTPDYISNDPPKDSEE